MQQLLSLTFTLNIFDIFIFSPQLLIYTFLISIYLYQQLLLQRITHVEVGNVLNARDELLPQHSARGEPMTFSYGVRNFF